MFDQRWLGNGQPGLENYDTVWPEVGQIWPKLGRNRPHSAKMGLETTRTWVSSKPCVPQRGFTHLCVPPVMGHARHSACGGGNALGFRVHTGHGLDLLLLGPRAGRPPTSHRHKQAGRRCSRAHPKLGDHNSELGRKCTQPVFVSLSPLPAQTAPALLPVPTAPICPKKRRHRDMTEAARPSPSRSRCASL